ncbi:MAG: hypothetical protein ACM3YO_08590 [Bacteroidota bacterium]
MPRSHVFFLLCLSLAFSAFSAFFAFADLPARALDADSLVKQASEVYAREMKGIVGYRATSESRIRSPIFNRMIQTEARVALKDGLPAGMVLVRMLVDGKPSSKEEREKQEAKTNESAPSTFFKAPYDARFMGDYSFRLDPDDAKAGKAIRFTSRRSDDQHGDGLMWIDERGRVLEVRYTPSKLPPNTTSGSIRLERGSLDGWFGNRLLKGDFEGEKGFIRGSFHFEQQFERYRRCKSVEEALAP